MKILLVEDDEALLEGLRQVLVSQHYLVECATDGLTGWELAESFEYDLILLDWTLPKLDGISFCHRLRSPGSTRSTTPGTHPNQNTPIILLTAEDSGDLRVLGLDAGADDYLTKPIAPQELLARIRAQLRRVGTTRSPILIWGNLSLNPDGCEVVCQNQRLSLTATEYEILELLMRNPQRIFSQGYLLEQLWQTEEMPTENTVRSHIKGLRQKLKKAESGDVIETVYGLGYRLREVSGEPEWGDGGGGGGGEVREEPESSPISNSQFLIPNSSPNALPNHLITIWEKYQSHYDNRVEIIQDAIAQLAEERLDPAGKERARREAHTLAGSLGSFTLHQAAQVARELEQRFKAPGLDSTQARSLSELATTLRHLIQQTLHSNPASTLESDGTNPESQIQNPKSHPATNHTHPKSQIPNSKSQIHILIVEDDSALAAAIQLEASRWGMASAIAASPDAARVHLDTDLPNGVVLDLTFPGLEQGGLQLLQEWADHYPTLPVIVFTAQEGLTERLAAARFGARMFLHKPIAPREVARAIAQVLQPTGFPVAKLLILDDDSAMLNHLQTLLQPWGFDVTVLDNPQQFWSTLEQTRPDLIILDIEMPEVNGLDLCQVVRNDAAWGNLPILMLSVHQDEQTITRVFVAGADDYISKPVVGPELIARITNRLQRRYKQAPLLPMKAAYHSLYQ